MALWFECLWCFLVIEDAATHEVGTEYKNFSGGSALLISEGSRMSERSRVYKV